MSRETEKYPEHEREHDEKILGATRNTLNNVRCQVLISRVNDQTIDGTFIWSPDLGRQKGDTPDFLSETLTMKQSYI